jgi:phasin
MNEKAARDFADKTTAYTKDALEKSKTAAAETTRVVEQSYKTASEGAVEFNLQFIEIAQTNLNAAFDLARQLSRVKSPSEFFELSTTHARKQLESFTQQTQQLATLAQKAATETARPFQVGIAKTFDQPFNKGS